MLDVEYKLLSYVKENQPCSWIDTLNNVRPLCDTDMSTLNAILRCALTSHQWIKKGSPADTPPFCSICLSSVGEYVLFSEEVKRAQKLQEMRSIRDRIALAEQNTAAQVQQVQELSRISQSLSAQLAEAKASALSADKSSRAANRIAVLAVVIAAASWLFPHSFLLQVFQ